ncbi:SDR family NAD(P)-dependent oxidoreductase [Streptomyces sp. NPDC059009]|uniref:SDR family NAD(P)-dependent oxidoreductase n=1 Tax=Streptomyces sp. NPDC059009 TaxID=3346694 RepID=UPI00369F576F
MDQSRFTDQVVIVTGGGSGIGAATVARSGREGATVISVGRTEEKLKQSAADASQGSRVVTRVADVSDGHDARFVNGAHIPVDGGLGASHGRPRIV